MSLLDDVSIVVTPNGYKAGTLFGVIPVPTEGAEEVTNGDFATDSDWSKAPSGVTISGGSANFNSASDTYVYQDILTTTKTYKIIFSGTINSGSLYIGENGVATNIYAAGTYTNEVAYFTVASSVRFIIRRIGTGTLDATIDNVSVKEYTSADMDVTRATAATRVDENGLVNYAEVIGSELVTCGDFSCAAPTNYWTATNAVISFANNQLTVDDTAGAGGDSRGSQAITTESGKTYRLTFNRISTTSLFYVGVGGGTSYNNIFYSSLGTDTGEYTLEFTATSSSSIIAFISGGNGITVFSNISVKEVTRDNVPRIDYTGGGCPHILAEPQRTNLVLDSNSAFNSTNMDLAYDNIISPDGTQNAYKSTTTTGSGANVRTLNVAFTTTSSFSVFLKYGNNQWYQIINSAAVNFYVNVDVQNGAFGTNGSQTENLSIQDYGNGWYRVSGTFTNSAGTGTLRIYTGSSSSHPWAGASAPIGSFNYGFGFQVENGSYPTSYIPTSGSTVTRNQDIFTRDGIGSLINSTEGVLFVEMAALENGGSNRVISLSDETNENLIFIRFDNTVSRIYGFMRGSGGSYKTLVVNSVNHTNNNKVALVWDATNVRLWVNGVESVSSSINDLPVGMSNLSLTNPTGGDILFGKVKQLQVYKTALTDDQIKQLTGESGTDFYESYAEMASALTYTIQ